MPADFSHCDLFIYMQQRFKYSSNLNTFLFHALCFPNSLLAEILLRINKYFAALVNFAVAAVQLENMCLDIVCQLDAENMLHSLFALLVFHREHDFYPLIKVSRHPDSTSHVNIFPAIIITIEDSAVLQKIPHNGTHMDILTESRNSGLQAADPPDDQLDFNACAGGLIKSRNNLLITQ